VQKKCRVFAHSKLTTASDCVPNSGKIRQSELSSIDFKASECALKLRQQGLASCRHPVGDAVTKQGFEEIKTGGILSEENSKVDRFDSVRESNNRSAGNSIGEKFV